MICLLSSYKLFTPTLLERISHQRESNARADRGFDPHYHEEHVFAKDIRSFDCFKIGSCKFLAEGVFNVLVNRLLYKHAPILLARFIKNAVLHPISHGPDS